MVCEKADLIASVCAIARAFQQYSRKSSSGTSLRNVTVEVVLTEKDGSLTQQDLTASK